MDMSHLESEPELDHPLLFLYSVPVKHWAKKELFPSLHSMLTQHLAFKGVLFL